MTSNEILSKLNIDAEKMKETCVRFIQEQVKGYNGICIGISGGLDSTTVLYLALSAVDDPKLIHCMHLPDRDSSSETTINANKLAKENGFQYIFKDITSELETRGVYKSVWMKVTSISGILNKVMKPIFYLVPRFIKRRMGVGKTLHDNFEAKHVARRDIIEAYAETKNLLVIGAGNRSEGFGGWFTFGGIDDVPVEPLFMVYKTQIKQLAVYLGVPEYVLEIKPSADMLKGLGDEDLIAASYDTIDTVAYIVENNLSRDLLEGTGIIAEEYDRLVQRRTDTEWKRVNPHIYPVF